MGFWTKNQQQRAQHSQPLRPQQVDSTLSEMPNNQDINQVNEYPIISDDNDLEKISEKTPLKTTEKKQPDRQIDQEMKELHSRTQKDVQHRFQERTEEDEEEFLLKKLEEIQRRKEEKIKLEQSAEQEELRFNPEVSSETYPETIYLSDAECLREILASNKNIERQLQEFRIRIEELLSR